MDNHYRIRIWFIVVAYVKVAQLTTSREDNVFSILSNNTSMTSKLPEDLREALLMSIKYLTIDILRKYTLQNKNVLKRLGAKLENITEKLLDNEIKMVEKQLEATNDQHERREIDNLKRSKLIEKLQQLVAEPEKFLSSIGGKQARNTLPREINNGTVKTVDVTKHSTVSYSSDNRSPSNTDTTDAKHSEEAVNGDSNEEYEDTETEVISTINMDSSKGTNQLSNVTSSIENDKGEQRSTQSGSTAKPDKALIIINQAGTTEVSFGYVKYNIKLNENQISQQLPTQKGIVYGIVYENNTDHDIYTTQEVIANTNANTSQNQTIISNTIQEPPSIKKEYTTATAILSKYLTSIYPTGTTKGHLDSETQDGTQIIVGNETEHTITTNLKRSTNTSKISVTEQTQNTEYNVGDTSDNRPEADDVHYQDDATEANSEEEYTEETTHQSKPNLEKYQQPGFVYPTSIYQHIPNISKLQIEIQNSTYVTSKTDNFQINTNKTADTSFQDETTHTSLTDQERLTKSIQVYNEDYGQNTEPTVDDTFEDVTESTNEDDQQEITEVHSEKTYTTKSHQNFHKYYQIGSLPTTTTISNLQTQPPQYSYATLKSGDVQTDHITKLVDISHVTNVPLTNTRESTRKTTYNEEKDWNTKYDGDEIFEEDRKSTGASYQDDVTQSLPSFKKEYTFEAHQVKPDLDDHMHEDLAQSMVSAIQTQTRDDKYITSKTENLQAVTNTPVEITFQGVTGHVVLIAQESSTKTSKIYNGEQNQNDDYDVDYVSKDNTQATDMVYEDEIIQTPVDSKNEYSTKRIQESNQNRDKDLEVSSVDHTFTTNNHFKIPNQNIELTTQKEMDITERVNITIQNVMIPVLSDNQSNFENTTNYVGKQYQHTTYGINDTLEEDTESSDVSDQDDFTQSPENFQTEYIKNNTYADTQDTVVNPQKDVLIIDHTSSTNSNIDTIAQNKNNVTSETTNQEVDITKPINISTKAEIDQSKATRSTGSYLEAQNQNTQEYDIEDTLRNNTEATDMVYEDEIIQTTVESENEYSTKRIQESDQNRNKDLAVSSVDHTFTTNNYFKIPNHNIELTTQKEMDITERVNITIQNEVIPVLSDNQSNFEITTDYVGKQYQHTTYGINDTLEEDTESSDASDLADFTQSPENFQTKYIKSNTYVDTQDTVVNLQKDVLIIDNTSSTNNNIHTIAQNKNNVTSETRKQEVDITKPINIFTKAEIGQSKATRSTGIYLEEQNQNTQEYDIEDTLRNNTEATDEIVLDNIPQTLANIEVKHTAETVHQSHKDSDKYLQTNSTMLDHTFITSNNLKSHNQLSDQEMDITKSINITIQDKVVYTLSTNPVIAVTQTSIDEQNQYDKHNVEIITEDNTEDTDASSQSNESTALYNSQTAYISEIAYQGNQNDEKHLQTNPVQVDDKLTTLNDVMTQTQTQFAEDDVEDIDEDDTEDDILQGYLTQTLANIEKKRAEEVTYKDYTSETIYQENQHRDHYLQTNSKLVLDLLPTHSDLKNNVFSIISSTKIDVTKPIAIADQDEVSQAVQVLSTDQEAISTTENYLEKQTSYTEHTVGDIDEDDTEDIEDDGMLQGYLTQTLENTERKRNGEVTNKEYTSETTHEDNQNQHQYLQINSSVRVTPSNLKTQNNLVLILQSLTMDANKPVTNSQYEISHTGHIPTSDQDASRTTSDYFENQNTSTEYKAEDTDKIDTEITVDGGMVEGYLTQASQDNRSTRNYFKTQGTNTEYDGENTEKDDTEVILDGGIMQGYLTQTETEEQHSGEVTFKEYTLKTTRGDNQHQDQYLQTNSIVVDDAVTTNVLKTQTQNSTFSIIHSVEINATKPITITNQNNISHITLSDEEATRTTNNDFEVQRPITEYGVENIDENNTEDTEEDSTLQSYLSETLTNNAKRQSEDITYENNNQTEDFYPETNLTMQEHKITSISNLKFQSIADANGALKTQTSTALPVIQESNMPSIIYVSNLKNNISQPTDQSDHQTDSTTIYHIEDRNRNTSKGVNNTIPNITSIDGITVKDTVSHSTFDIHNGNAVSANYQRYTGKEYLQTSLIEENQTNTPKRTTNRPHIQNDTTMTLGDQGGETSTEDYDYVSEEYNQEILRVNINSEKTKKGQTEPTINHNEKVMRLSNKRNKIKNSITETTTKDFLFGIPKQQTTILPNEINMIMNPTIEQIVNQNVSLQFQEDIQ